MDPLHLYFEHKGWFCRFCWRGCAAIGGHTGVLLLHGLVRRKNFSNVSEQLVINIHVFKRFASDLICLIYIILPT